MVVIAAIEPKESTDLFATRTFAFDNAWLVPVLFLAALFVGYLCFDAWMVRRRNQRLNEWRRHAKRPVPTGQIRR